MVSEAFALGHAGVAAPRRCWRPLCQAWSSRRPQLIPRRLCGGEAQAGAGSPGVGAVEGRGTALCSGHRQGFGPVGICSVRWSGPCTG